MPLQCNIDGRGRRVRGFSGALFLLLALIFIIFRWVPVWWEWILAVAVLAIGLFQIFEARRGWCALRAMGFRTPV